MAVLNSTVVNGDLSVVEQATLQAAKVGTFVGTQVSGNAGSYIAASTFASSPPSGIQGQVLFVVQGV